MGRGGGVEVNPVDIFVRYAAACRDVGHVGITSERIRELASREDGVGLAALQSDIAALAAAAGHARSALSEQRTAIGVLGAGWRGRSGSIATAVLEQHCTAAADILHSLVEAADVLERLRGTLSRLLAERDEAGVRIADRRSAERPRWLACSEAVLAGTADGVAVAEVRTRIAPFLDAQVAGEWAGSVSSVSDAVDAAYRQAAIALAGRMPVGFDVPSGLARAPVPAPVGKRPAAFAVRGAESTPFTSGVGMPNISPGSPGFAGGGSEPAFAAAPGGVFADPALDPAAGRLPGGLPRAEVPELRGRENEPEADPEPESDLEPEPDLKADAEAEPEPDPESQVPLAAESTSEPDPDSEPGAGQIGSELPTAAADPVPPAGVFGATPKPEPSQPEQSAAEAGLGVEERTPCEIAADALPQIGQ